MLFTDAVAVDKANTPIDDKITPPLPVAARGRCEAYLDRLESETGFESKRSKTFND